MPQAKVPYPKDELSPEWLAAYCYNWRMGLADTRRRDDWLRLGHISFAYRGGGRDSLFIQNADIERLQTYKAILEHIETELAIKQVTNAAAN